MPSLFNSRSRLIVRPLRTIDTVYSRRSASSEALFLECPNTHTHTHTHIHTYVVCTFLFQPAKDVKEAEEKATPTKSTSNKAAKKAVKLSLQELHSAASTGMSEEL